MNSICCKIEKVTPFNDAVYQVLLRPQTPLAFAAGQYLSIVMDDNDKRPFSIASAPGSELLELHIGAAVSESYPMQVIERLQHSDTITIEAPAGNAFLRHQSPRPRLLIAGGTGFSYIKSIIEQQMALGLQVETLFYWGCRTAEAMYGADMVHQWQQRHPWLHFVPVVEQAPANWQGKTNLLLAQIKQDFVSVADYDIYIAGRFPMVGAAREMFREMGVDEAHLYGDAFAFIK
ncbi:NAD(P)H-flavin reductase [Shewanella sp. YIC-542]|uniref:NAD(P)H-flavin reductase n=1 Tax=Shewanella mytili TaxID=3377111 RepID=UPI00398E9F68